MSAAANEVLARAGVGIEDIALVVPHQANLNHSADRQGAGRFRRESLCERTGVRNTGSASIPLAPWEARKQGRIAAGDLVLLTSFGAGFHWASMLLRF